jgi:predicted transposase YdaD
MFDNVSKFLVENFSEDYATWLLGHPVTFTKLSPTELSLEPIRADSLRMSVIPGSNQGSN